MSSSYTTFASGSGWYPTADTGGYGYGELEAITMASCAPPTSHDDLFSPADDSILYGTGPSHSVDPPTNWQSSTPQPEIEHEEPTAYVLGDSEHNYGPYVTTAMDQAKTYMQGYTPPKMTLITNQDVDEAMAAADNSTHRETDAIRFILLTVLYNLGFPSRECDTEQFTLALQEASYQILSRVEGEERNEICRFSLLSVLEQLSPSTNDDPQPSATGSSRPRHVCTYPDCNQSFKRNADLERHTNSVHVNPPGRYYCDYRRCPRHENHFTRQDHFRDHLRDLHKEDLVRRGLGANPEWWATRSRNAVFGGWWRCSRCFARVQIASNGYTCQCGNQLETARRFHRAENAYGATGVN
ncbi:hypothetical protein OQA88_9 [Cercophora sp. LCS_1]